MLAEKSIRPFTEPFVLNPMEFIPLHGKNDLVQNRDELRPVFPDMNDHFYGILFDQQDVVDRALQFILALARILATQVGMTNKWIKEQGLISVKDQWVKIHYPASAR